MSRRVFILALSFAVLFAVVTYAVNPGSPFHPSDNIQDPNCLPTDSNCFVTYDTYDDSFNGNRTVTRAGIANINPGGTTIKEFLENYFYPSVGPGAALAGGSARELGASTAVTLSFTATKNTSAITSIVLSTASSGASITATGPDTPSSGTTTSLSIAPTGNTQSSSRSAATGANSNATYTITVLSGSDSSTATTSVTYQNRKYYGVSSKDNIGTPMTSADIIALSTKPLASARTETCTLSSPCSFSPSGQYVYFAWPASFEPSGSCKAVLPGTLTAVGTFDCFKQGATAVTDFEVTDLTFTNASGYTTAYKVYRGKNLLTGSISYSTL